MRKKIIALAVTVFMLTTLLVGCGSSESGKSGKQEVGEKTDTPATITIFHHMGEEAKKKALQTLTDNFTKEHPNVKFDIQSTDGGQYVSLLKTKISAGEAPDIMFKRPKSMPELIEAGQIMDLSGQDYIKNMQVAALPSLTINGKVYGIALDVTAIGVLYNKDVFEKYGLSAPKTLDEYDNIIKTLNTAGILPFARGYQDSWTAEMEYQSNQFYVLKEDPNFFGAIQAGEKKFSDYPIVKQSLEVIKDHLKYGNKDIFGTTDARAYELVATGEAAMINQGFWGISNLEALSPNTNFGFFAPPISNEGEPQAHAFADDAFMISEVSNHKDICNRFFSYIMSPEGGKTWLGISGQIPFIKGLDGSEVKSGAALDLLAYINSGNSFGQEDNATFAGQFDAVYKEYQELFPAVVDQMSIDAFIKQMDDEFDSIR